MKTRTTTRILRAASAARAPAALAALLSLVTGCATTSQVVPYGKDTYMVAAEDVLGVGSSSSMQVNAARKASEFCAGQGKTMRVRNATQEGTQMWTGTSSSLVFSCITESDPENTRPNLVPNPR